MVDSRGGYSPRFWVPGSAAKIFGSGVEMEDLGINHACREGEIGKIRGVGKE